MKQNTQQSKHEHVILDAVGRSSTGVALILSFFYDTSFFPLTCDHSQQKYREVPPEVKHASCHRLCLSHNTEERSVFWWVAGGASPHVLNNRPPYFCRRRFWFRKNGPPIRSHHDPARQDPQVRNEHTRVKTSSLPRVSLTCRLCLSASSIE